MKSLVGETGRLDFLFPSLDAQQLLQLQQVEQGSLKFV